jgi:16S rRNA (uracil1498-N3)-methyltransferase
VLPRFFAPGTHIERGVVTLPSDESHHLTNVLRLAVGDEVAVFDGEGHEWRGRVASASRRAATIELGIAITPVSESSVHVTLGIGILKSDQMDAVVRDATALGVSAIMPIDSAHVAVPARVRESEAAIDRWRRIAIAAAKQSRRAVVPAIASTTPFSAAVEAAARSSIYLCLEPARAASAAGDANDRRPASAFVFVGPEGGWSDEEVAVATAHGARPLVLGPRTLRADLAPLVALSTLWTRWGW